MTPLDALYRCQRAWEASQPQLFFELWPDDGLNETEGGVSDLGLVEPVRIPSHRRGQGGLTAGAEPRRGLLGTDGRSSSFASPSGLSPRGSGGSAPPTNQTGRHATPAEEARAAQEVTL